MVRVQIAKCYEPRLASVPRSPFPLIERAAALPYALPIWFPSHDACPKGRRLTVYITDEVVLVDERMHKLSTMFCPGVDGTADRRR